MSDPNRTAPASQPPAAVVPAATPVIADPKAELVPKDDAVPKYRLMEPAYIADKRHEVGETIFWSQKPEYYMHPLNAAARNAHRKYKPEWKDPLGELPIAPEAQQIT